MDWFSYCAPARVKTLVVPVGNVTLDEFESYFSQSLSKYYEVRLVDVTPCGGMFNPQGYPHGRIIYDYQLALADPESLFLEDFEPHRKVFNVMGLTPYTPDLDLELLLMQMRKEHSTAINHNLLVFNTPSGVNQGSSSTKNIFHIPSLQNVTVLETVICDITSNFLQALTSYASSYQHVTLRSPGTIGVTETSGMGLRRTISNGFSSNHPITAARNSSASAPSLDKKKKRISSANFLPNFENNSGLLNQERMRANRTKGRQQKIFGNFYLLSGRLGDSLREFCDAIVLLKSSNDYLWLGSALEGLGVCLMMLTFLEVPLQLPSAVLSIITSESITQSGVIDLSILTPTTSPRNSTASGTRSLTVQSMSSPRPSLTTNPSSDLNSPPICDLIIQLSSKAVKYYKQTFDQVEDYLPQIVYCETVLRLVKLLSLVHINDGFDFTLMRHIVKGIPLTTTKEESQSIFVVSQSIDKTQIAQIENEIFTPQFNKLDFIHKVRIYSCLISVANDLKLNRRRSFLIKELFDLITPKLNEKSAEINTTFSAVARDSGVSLDYDKNMASIIDLIEGVLQNYGITTSCTEPNPEIRSRSPNWSELHLSILDRVIELTERLGFFESSLKYNSLLLKEYSSVLEPQKQLEIFGRIKRQMKQLLLKDNEYTLQYWDDFFVKDIISIPSVTDLTPIKNTSGVESTVNAKKKFYTPFTSGDDLETELVTLVQGEPTDIVITLRNPFAFDIDIKNLEIICLDSFKLKTVQYFPSMQSQQQETRLESIVIRAGQVLNLDVVIVALQLGDLKISGVKAEVCDCLPRVFKIQSLKTHLVYEKIKSVGVNNFLDSHELNLLYEQTLLAPVYKSLNYHVLSPQPVLSLVDNSLLNHAIMILEGEMKTFSFTLQNNSDVTINHLSSVFLDSTTEFLRTALQSKLPPNEIYEIEYYLLKKSPFSITNKSELSSILGKKTFSIDVSLWGKRGMTFGSVMLEYGNNPEHQPLQYIRRIDIPIKVSVYSSIEISSCDVIPVFNSDEIFNTNSHLLSKTGKARFWSYLNSRLGEGEKLTDYCLLVIDFRNSWTADLKVELTSSSFPLFDDDMLPLVDDTGDESLKVSLESVIGHGKTEKFLLPIKRISLSEELLSTPIPSLRNKQFIVDNSTPKEEQDFVREAFWYRKALLKYIKGTWKTTGDSGSQIHGEIELRGIRLSWKMLNILRVDTVEIEHKIFYQDQLITESDSLSYKLDLEKLYTIKTTVINRSSKELYGMFRHIPISKSTSMSIDRKLLYNGVLQFHLPHLLGANESVDFEMSMCVLESGEYEWGAVFDELKVDQDGNIEEGETHTQRRSLHITAA